METSKVSVDFSDNKYSDEELVVEARNVVGNMTDNADLPSPSPSLTEITEAVDSLETAIVKAKTGNTHDTAVKNEKREELENLLKEAAAYVQTTSKGNEAIILSSGFSVNKKASPVGILPAPENVKAAAGANKGSLEISWESVANAHSYLLVYTEVPYTESSVWSYISITKHKTTVEGLTSGQQYAFKVTAVGSDVTRVWSDVITSYVL